MALLTSSSDQSPYINCRCCHISICLKTNLLVQKKKKNKKNKTDNFSLQKIISKKIEMSVFLINVLNFPSWKCHLTGSV